MPICLAVAALVAAGCGSDDDTKTAEIPAASAPADTQASETTPATTTETTQDPSLAQKPDVEVPKGPAPKKLGIKDLIEGTGAAAKDGDVVSVDYVGVLYKDGTEFDTSWGKNQPFQFQLGAGQVIPGWDQGLKGMKVGGRRELVIPAAMAYGKEGSPPTIPPNAPLVFVVDLKEVTS